MIRIQYISDIHLEMTRNLDYWSTNKIEPIGDILILAGDITKLTRVHLGHPFFDQISKDFEQVFYVPGNHEYYDITDLSLINKESLEMDIRPNVKVVNNKSINYKGINFIFTTLWSHIPVRDQFVVPAGVACFSHIKTGKEYINVKKWNEIHMDSKFFLVNALADIKEGKTIVVTHHVPTTLCVCDAHKNSPINSAFCTELFDIIYDSNINYWIYGHSHRNIDIEINGTKLITNQFGYAHMFEQDGFDENKYIEINNE